MVAGNASSERGEDHRHDAARVHLERDVRARPAVHAPAHHALGVVHRDAAMRPLHVHDARDHRHHHQQQQRQPQQADFARLQLIQRRHHRARQPDDDARVDDERHAVADAALGDLLAEPHHEDRARGQREHGQQAEAPARLVHQRQATGDVGLPLQEDRDAERLDDRQQDRPVAGVLRDLPATQLAFLRDALEGRPHHRQQLQDDRRADVRHHAEREDRHARQVAARKQVVQAEHRVARLLGQQRQRLGVHTGRRDVVANAEHAEQPQREQHPDAELRDGEDVPQAIHRSSRCLSGPSACEPSGRS